MALGFEVLPDDLLLYVAQFLAIHDLRSTSAALGEDRDGGAFGVCCRRLAAARLRVMTWISLKSASSRVYATAFAGTEYEGQVVSKECSIEAVVPGLRALETLDSHVAAAVGLGCSTLRVVIFCASHREGWTPGDLVRLLDRCTSVHELHIHGASIPVEMGDTTLPRLPVCRTIQLQHCDGLTTGLLERLGECAPGLERLEVLLCKPSGPAVRLPRVPHLRHLALLAGTQHQWFDARPLTPCTGLRSLEIMSAAGLRLPARLSTALVQLELIGCSVDDVMLGHFWTTSAPSVENTLDWPPGSAFGNGAARLNLAWGAIGPAMAGSPTVAAPPTSETAQAPPLAPSLSPPGSTCDLPRGLCSLSLAMNERLMRPLISGSALRRADLSHCNLLRDEAVTYLCAWCPRLEELLLDYCSAQRRPQLGGRALTSVSMAGCVRLHDDAVRLLCERAPALTVLLLDGCRALTAALELASPSLARLSLRSTSLVAAVPRIRNACPRLASVEGEGPTQAFPGHAS